MTIGLYSYLRFTNFEDKTWFENTLVRVLEQQLGEDVASLLMQEPYFVDFLRDAPEPTGEEADDADFEAPKVRTTALNNSFSSLNLQRRPSLGKGREEGENEWVWP